VRVAPLSRVTTPVLRRARRAASQIVSEGLDRSAAAGATLAAAARRRLAAGHRAAEAQMRRLLPLLIESGRRAEDLALRTAAWAAPQLEWTRAVAGEAYRDALTGARRGLGRLRVEAARLPHPAIAAAVALLLVAVVPLGDAARVQVAAPTPAAAPPPVRVQVNARPWAQVKVDGIDVGPTPLSHLELAPGPHAFEARFPDGRVLRRRIEIGPAHRFVSLP
jgi:non-specific serine/threonine protein kinase